MAHDFLIFDFETNEGAAQQARHRVEGWTQGFRLGKKMLLKFEREEANELKEAGNSGAKGGPGWSGPSVARPRGKGDG